MNIQYYHFLVSTNIFKRLHDGGNTLYYYGNIQHIQ